MATATATEGTRHDGRRAVTGAKGGDRRQGQTASQPASAENTYMYMYVLCNEPAACNCCCGET